MSDELLEIAHRIARYWAERSDRWLLDEYESVTTAAAGEAMARHDPDRIPLKAYAVYLMHKRCRDFQRTWVISKKGTRRAHPYSPDYLIEVLDAPAPPYDDTAWLLGQLLAAVDRARDGGMVSERARTAVLLWIELGEQVLVAERLGVTASRVSQLVHEVIDAVHAIGVAS